MRLFASARFGGSGSGFGWGFGFGFWGSALIAVRFGCGTLVNDLPHLVELFVDLAFCAMEAMLAQVDRIRKQRATLLDTLRVTAVRQFDAFTFHKFRCQS